MNPQDNRSIQELTQAIEIDPTDTNAHFYRGYAYEINGNYDKAIADYTRAIRLKPNFTKTYNNRGTTQGRKGEYSKAIADLNKAIQLDPNYAVAYHNRGVAYAKKGDDNQANADFAKEKELKNWGVKIGNLCTQAMNPNVETRYPLPKLDDRDLQLAGEWCRPSRYNLDRTSLIAARSRKERELDRLLSARSAEKVAANFYSFYGKTVEDISISQIEKNRKSEWEKSDLYVDDLYIDGFSVDVKNSRQSQKSPDRYTEHYIQKKFKHNTEYQNVTIAGVFSPYLWTYELLGEPESYHEYREIQFLGETTWEKLQELKREFKDSVYFEVPNPTGNFFSLHGSLTIPIMFTQNEIKH